MQIIKKIVREAQKEERARIPEHARKYHFWRGFWVCVVLVVVPGMIAFIVFCQQLITIIN